MLKSIFWSVILMSLFSFGCQKQQEVVVKPFEVSPSIKSDAGLPQAQLAMFENAGGLQNWLDINKLDARPVVTFFDDGLHYITEQRHEIYPWANAINISADEPKGPVSWQLVRSLPTETFSWDADGTMPSTIPLKVFAEAVLELTTSAVRIADPNVSLVQQGEPRRIEGRLYTEYQRTPEVTAKQANQWLPMKWYQNAETGLFDMVIFTEAVSNGSITAKAFGLRKVENTAVFVPEKIEFYRTDPRGVILELLATVDY